MSFIPGDLDNGAMADMGPDGSATNTPVKIGFGKNYDHNLDLGEGDDAENGIVGASGKDTQEDSGVYDWIVDIDMISKVRTTQNCL